MKKLLLYILCITLIKITFAQADFECYTPDENPILKSAGCNDWNDYVPVDPAVTPVKYVRVTFHIIQDNSGTNNFPENSASTNWLQNVLLSSLNSKFANMQQMNLPTSSPHISDTRIRFTLANIYFWQDDDGWSYQQTHSFGEYLYSTFVINQTNVAYKENSVHIFMSENTSGCKGRASGIGNKRWITLGGIYAKYLQNNHWSPTNMAHELGHSLGLNHSWINDEWDDTPNHPNCWNTYDPDIPECAVPSNNLMDENACSCAITMSQVQRMHNCLLGNTNIGDCLINSVTPQTPTVNGPELICYSGEEFTIDNLQLGVEVKAQRSSTYLFYYISQCGNEQILTPSSSVVSGIGEINFIFDYVDYGSTSVIKKVWVGKDDIINLCELNSSIYHASTINCPGSNCQPQSLVVGNGDSLNLIGDEVNLNGGFEVQLGGSLKINVDSGCN